MTLLPTYLVQRLDPKPLSERHALASQIFGGAMLGLSKDAWRVCQQIFDFHYMGAAEYEFGRVPRALSALMEDRADLVTFELVLGRDDIALNYAREYEARQARAKELAAAKAAGVKPKRARKKSALQPDFEPRTVYVLCRAGHREGAEAAIRGLALQKIHCKAWDGVADALDPVVDPKRASRDSIGWLELDNGFLFFIDREAFEATVRLFKGEGET